MRQCGQSASPEGEPRKLRRSQSGLTVIEIIIVFAVGGLILMMVLLAIPALQRNSRNNQRKQDVQSILGAVSQWQLNHSGNIPTATDPYLQNAKTKLTFYDPTNVYIQGGSSSWTPAPNPVAVSDRVYIYNYQKCSTAGAGTSTATGAGYSDIVALYTIENRNNLAPKCQQL